MNIFQSTIVTCQYDIIFAFFLSKTIGVRPQETVKFPLQSVYVFISRKRGLLLTTLYQNILVMKERRKKHQGLVRCPVTVSSATNTMHKMHTSQTWKKKVLC